MCIRDRSLVAENYFGHFGFHITSSDTETATFNISFAFAEGFSENGKLRSKTRSGKFIRAFPKQRQECLLENIDRGFA